MFDTQAVGRRPSRCYIALGVACFALASSEAMLPASASSLRMDGSWAFLGVGAIGTIFRRPWGRWLSYFFSILMLPGLCHRHHRRWLDDLSFDDLPLISFAGHPRVGGLTRALLHDTADELCAMANDLGQHRTTLCSVPSDRKRPSSEAAAGAGLWRARVGAEHPRCKAAFSTDPYSDHTKKKGATLVAPLSA